MVPEIGSKTRNQGQTRELVVCDLGEKAMWINGHCGAGRDEK
jgi:hypothetical protein